MGSEFWQMLHVSLVYTDVQMLHRLQLGMGVDWGFSPAGLSTQNKHAFG